jgi:hypothetical protein
MSVPFLRMENLSRGSPMNGDFCRPSVQEMIFCLFDRPLHPELFETLASRRVERDDYTLTVRITPTGHLLSWHRGDIHLAELTAAGSQLLPSHGSLLRHRFEGERTGAIKPVRGISYQMSSQIEILPPEIFVHVHDEFRADGAKRGLLYHHVPHHRLSLSPLSFITVEAWKSTLSVNAFHTFPNECAIVKTQSLIERI